MSHLADHILQTGRIKFNSYDDDILQTGRIQCCIADDIFQTGRIQRYLV